MTTRLAELDHLIVAANSLEAGMAHLEPLLGVSFAPGGRHLGFGTHNRLLSLGPEVYLELIAPDPGQPELGRPRPFSLDEAWIRERIAGRPRLIHYVCRSRRLEAARTVLAPWSAAAITMRRDDLVWRITIPEDGKLPGGTALGGVLPSLIDWGDTPHPCTRLPDLGLRLQALEVGAPASAMEPLRALLGEAPALRLAAGEPAQCARLQSGNRTLVLD
ncbi:MAG: VOC family protein [Burkholderiales bacterium]|nr:MAG: VOC family protein [Burkholderiales bacterium]